MKVTVINLCCFLLITLCGLSEAFSELENEREYSLVKKLTATCGKDGIKVSVRFTEPFLGIVYSDGYYDKAPCVFINQENHTSVNTSPPETRFSFLIPADECGTVFHDPGSSLSSRLDNEDDDVKTPKVDKNELGNEVFMENTVMFQRNPFIQEQGDILQKLRCVWQKEIRKPLHATLPLRGKLRHKTENVKVVKPMAPLNYKKVPIKHATQYHLSESKSHTQGMSTTTTTTSQPVTPNRYGSVSRKRFQPVGQVESVSPFSTNRRDGKSLKYHQPVPIESALYSDTFQTMFNNLPNLTALPFRQDDVGRSGTAGRKGGFGMLTWIIVFTNFAVVRELTSMLFQTPLGSNY